MRFMRVVYGGLVFLSAFLLFVMEPMAAKHLLPLLGGSSAVWVTCLVFFQAALLVGYLYAHWMSRQKRMWVHLCLAVAAVLVLLTPMMLGFVSGIIGVTVEPDWGDTTHPVSTIFSMLGASIGLPFVLLSSTSPLLQVWWTRQMGAAVPYRLFALSNAGSLLALAMYPTVIEPHMSLAMQRNWWLAGFMVYAAVSVWLGGRVAKSSQRISQVEPLLRELQPVEAPRQRWMWFLLPMGASMQLAAVTSHLSQDIAAIPLLWVLPLGVYLLTFIVAFEMPSLYRRSFVSRLMIVMLASLGYALSRLDTRLPVGLAVLFYMVEVFVTCWFCHAETYRLRPAGATHSTTFYLMIAGGGVGGTFLIAIASPLLFRSNYDLALAFLATAVLGALVMWNEGWSQRALWTTASVLLLGTAIALHVQFGRNALVRTRNFYGSLRVTAADFEDQGEDKANASATAGPVRVLMNGRIRHGTQMMLDAEHRKLPTTYYAEESGVGIALRNCCEGRPKRVGVVGLGVGTIATYGQPGDTLQFYEINSLVEPIARNLFTYLRESAATVTVVNGDGRLALKREPPQAFDVLVVDAFTGDAIPLHLLTREAMEVYRRQITPGGIVAFHVSNSYVDLAPEIARVAESENMQTRVVESFAVPAEGAYRATWVLVSANADFFAMPAVQAAAVPVSRRPDLRVWTDDYSSLLPVMRLGR
jgi:spermidine synthase